MFVRIASQAASAMTGHVYFCPTVQGIAAARRGRHTLVIATEKYGGITLPSQQQAHMRGDRRRAVRGIVGILAALQAPSVIAQQRLLIGQSAPLSGSNVDFGRAISAGARACFLRHNTLSNSVPIEYLTLDDGNDAARAGKNTESFLTQGVGVLFGYASATLSLPALPHARRNGVPFFAPFTGAATIHNARDPLLFTARASYAQEAEKFVEAIKSFGVKTVAVVHYADRVGNENRDLVTEVIQRNGLQATAPIAVERNQPVPPELARSLVAQQPHAVLFTVLAAPTAELVRQARAAGLRQLTFLIALSFVGPSQLTRLLGDEARGIVVSHVVPRPWDDLDIVKEHRLAMSALPTSETPSFASLEAYIAARALTFALERARRARTDALLAALEELNADFGGYRLRYGKNVRNGSSYVDYTILGKQTVR
jgi:branched-chain amino acid transport system substrate-binding protein